jgi:hypothetical protein
MKRTQKLKKSQQKQAEFAVIDFFTCLFAEKEYFNRLTPFFRKTVLEEQIGFV